MHLLVLADSYGSIKQGGYKDEAPSPIGTLVKLTESLISWEVR